MEIADYGPNIYPGNPFPDDVPAGSSEIRWFRRAKEAARLQGPNNTELTTGTMHPNEYGRKLYRDRLLSSIFLPVEINGIGAKDNDDSMHEAILLRSENFRISYPLNEGKSLSLGPQIWPRSDVDMYEIHGSKGEAISVTISVEPDSDDPTAPKVNPAIRFFDESGKEILSEGEVNCHVINELLNTPVDITPTEVQSTSIDHGPIVALDQIRNSLQVTSLSVKTLFFKKTLRIGEPGKYYIGISDINNLRYDPLSGMGDESGKNTGHYSILLSSQSVDDAIPCANILAIPSEANGFANETLHDLDFFKFSLEKQSKISIVFKKIDKRNNVITQLFQAAPVAQVKLFDHRSQLIDKVDGSMVKELAAGVYYIGVSSSSRGNYDALTGNAPGALTPSEKERLRKPGFGFYSLVVKKN